MATLKRLIADLRATFSGSHKIPVMRDGGTIGYNPVMVQRPIIGVGNAPQYWLDAQMVGFTAITGGGTMPTHGPPRPCGGPNLDWQTHTFGGVTQSGTLTPSRQLVPLAQQGEIKTIGDRR